MVFALAPSKKGIIGFLCRYIDGYPRSISKSMANPQTHARLLAKAFCLQFTLGKDSVVVVLAHAVGYLTA